MLRLTRSPSAALLLWRSQGALPAGSKYDLLRGAAPSHEEKEDKVVKRLVRSSVPFRPLLWAAWAAVPPLVTPGTGLPHLLTRAPQHGTVKFGSKSHAECCTFMRDGRRLVTGTVDGFVEVWDVETCRLDKSLAYQDSVRDSLPRFPLSLCPILRPSSARSSPGMGSHAQDEVMLHDAAVHALACSADSELLASGSQDGCLKVRPWLPPGRVVFRKGMVSTFGVVCVCRKWLTTDGRRCTRCGD